MELWTPAHGQTLPPALAGMVLLTVLLAALVKRRPHLRMLPLQILSCLLLLLELGKQGLSLWRGYDLYHLPFHFCSLFIFVLPFMAFYRGKHTAVVRSVTTALCGAVFLLMLIYPNLIYGAGSIRDFFQDYFSFHTVAFHNLVMLAFLLILALGLFQPTPKADRKAVTLFTFGFCAIAATMSQLLKTNYANFYTCNIPVLETLRGSVQEVLGYGLTQLLYVLIVAALHILFVRMCYELSRLTHSLLNKTKQPV